MLRTNFDSTKTSKKVATNLKAIVPQKTPKVTKMQETTSSTSLSKFLKNAPCDIISEYSRELSNIVDNSRSDFVKFMNEWAESIEIYGDVETTKDILEAEAEFSRGETIEWHPGMYLE